MEYAFFLCLTSKDFGSLISSIGYLNFIWPEVEYLVSGVKTFDFCMLLPIFCMIYGQKYKEVICLSLFLKPSKFILNMQKGNERNLSPRGKRSF